jgi:UDP-N-acetylglucosamine 2-epimerase (non-hydrolysing)
MGIPYITLDDSTERPETVEIGTNELIGTDPELLRKSLAMVIDGKLKKGGILQKWDGKSAERIVSAIESSLA